MSPRLKSRPTQWAKAVPFKPGSVSDVPKRPPAKPKAVQPKPSPPYASASSSKDTLPISITRNVTASRIIIEIMSESEDDACVVAVRPRANPSPQRPPIPTNPEDTVDVATSAGDTDSSDPLPPSLADILAENSALSGQSKCLDHIHMSYLADAFSLAFYELRRRIAADPTYLGEPKHISLRHRTGSAAKRRMRVPQNTTSKKYYAISCGTEVGIFLRW